MKRYYLFIIAAILFLGSSCKKDFLSVNETNPNTAKAVPGNLILPAALNATANIMNSPRNFDFVYLWYGQWSISSGYSQPNDLTQYNIRNSSYQGDFDAFYLAANAFNDIEKNSSAPQEAYYLAIAKIMKAYIFTNLVDLYGDVPYTEAFQGAANFKPKYDNQKTIYEDCVTQIEKAVAAIKAAPVDVTIVTSAYDIMYKGDMTKWIKFANTLKLRILLHQADMTGRYTSYIQPALAKISGGYIGTGEGAMFNPGYLNSAGKMNPLWGTFYAADGTTNADGIAYYKAGKDAINIMWNSIPGEDWRVYAHFKEYNTSYALGGNYFGALVSSLAGPAVVSSLGPGLLKSFDQSSIILSDFESLFLQAEAAQRGWIGTPADAKTFYYAALKANYTFLGLTAKKWLTTYGITGTSDYDDFVASNAGYALIDFDAATNKLQTIITQKWVSLLGNTPIEIWTDYRRTGFPTFIHWSADPLKLNATPPVRLLYPQREISTNEANVPTGINLFTSKIFWQAR
jgi:hypothetical protein